LKQDNIAHLKSPHTGKRCEKLGARKIAEFNRAPQHD